MKNKPKEYRFVIAMTDSGPGTMCLCGFGPTKKLAELHGNYLKAEWLWQHELSRWAK